MVIEGKIVTVMESWPPQLVVETQSGRYHIGLLEETKITRAGEVVDLNELISDLRIRAEGQLTGPNAMLAQTIDILVEDK